MMYTTPVLSTVICSTGPAWKGPAWNFTTDITGNGPGPEYGPAHRSGNQPGLRPLTGLGDVYNLNNSSICDFTPTGPPTLPEDMRFNQDTLVSVVSYCCLFVIAAVGNLTVFITLFRNRHRKSRVNLFIMHLSVADLIVTFIMLPLETIWHITVAWQAGDIACRVMMFFRAFGFYLSSFILVTISLDRYFAILHPLSLQDADKRGKIMLVLAWLFSLVASVPQSVIFHVEHHPQFPWFSQCVTFNFFPTRTHELAYNLFNIITVYGLPLVVIIISYTLILCEMSRKTREGKEDSHMLNGSVRGRERLRRSGVGKLQRAKIRTLKMTIMIVFVFIMCWTPYFVISAWWWFDKDSADRVNPKVQRGLFIFAVSNSCMDPLVYGMFTTVFRREVQRCCCFIQFQFSRLRNFSSSHRARFRHYSRSSMFTINFKREFKRCCCCLREHFRQQEVTSQMLRQYTLQPTHTSSIQSSCSVNGISFHVKRGSRFLGTHLKPTPGPDPQDSDQLMKRSPTPPYIALGTGIMSSTSQQYSCL